MTLGKRIKKLRQDKGLTQAQLGYMVNKGESTVRTWELDRSQPSPQTIRLLCDVLGTTPNALLGKEEKEEPVSFFNCVPRYCSVTCSLLAVSSRLIPSL